MHRFRLLTALAVAAAATPIGASAFESTAVASWYGARHQGKRTSSGDIFDQERMTAASASLPLGSRVRVTMQDTGRSVVVLINDRMGAKHSAIDLSRGAARQIGLLARGRGAVMIASSTDEPVEVAEASEDEIGDVGSNGGSRPARIRRAHRHAGVGTHAVFGPAIVLIHQTMHAHPRAARRVA